MTFLSYFQTLLGKKFRLMVCGRRISDQDMCVNVLPKKDMVERNITSDSSEFSDRTKYIEILFLNTSLVETSDIRKT